MFTVAGYPKFASIFCDEADRIAKNNPFGMCLASANYAKLQFYGGEGSVSKSLHYCQEAKLCMEGVGEMRR